MLNTGSLSLCVRPLEAVAVILRTISGHMESLTLELFGTHLLDVAIATDEL